MTDTVAVPIRPSAAPTFGRQRFLAWGIVAIGGFIASAVAVPIVSAIVAPAFKQRAGEWLDLGAVADFKPGEPTSVDLSLNRKDGWIERMEQVSVWVTRSTDDALTVFHGKCTHLGCAYSWKADVKEFLCPCHTARFAPDGTVLGGPPPRPLDTLPIKVEAGKILVQYKDFKLGVTEKAEL